MSVPEIWILDGKEIGTIRWHYSRLINLECFSSILFN